MRLVIFGLGRIGLPISLVCAESGYHVTGVDINKELINSLKKGKIAFEEKGMQEILKKNLNKNFFPKHQQDGIEQDIKKAEYIMIAVGTGFAKYPEKPKLSVLFSIIGQLISLGLKNKTMILRVTLPVGTSEDIINMIEKKTGLTEGKDFWFAFVPERIMEGKAIKEESSLPKIIGANSEEGYKKVKKFFKKIGGETIKVSNPRTAEFVKLIDNSWRNTRFAFANELAYLAEENKLDAIEAINSANQGYQRNQIPKPGPVSGYCLGKDPYLLEIAFKKTSKKRGFNSTWFYGRQANDWLVEKIVNQVKGKKILIAGLSFKENIDDYRYSHAIDIADKLLKKGYEVSVYDPFINMNYYTTLPKEMDIKVKSYKDFEKAFEKQIDTIIFTTNHKQIKKLKLNKILEKKPKSKKIKIIDLWNIFPELENNKSVVYNALGNGKK